MIQIQGLSFRFQSSPRYALRDLNLQIAPGEFVVITGPSGCGKSTLALAIGGYLFRQYDGQAEGTVIVSGMDARQAPIYDVAEIVGLVQQNPEAQFCTLTVRDEIAFGLENRRLPQDEIRQRIEWALGIVGAAHLIERPLAALSGGEKQKIAIAAVMAAKPQTLIFDEPTSNLDPTATAEIFDVIEHIQDKAGVTVIVIEHKIDYLLPFEPRMVVMESGHIVYDGQGRGKETRGQGDKWTGRQGDRETSEQGETVVEVVDLGVGYNGDTVLHDLSLEIGQGEFVAVMGDNGSGKTTFLHSLLGLLKPDQGRVEVLGQDTRHTPISRLARQVGFVFQNPDHQLFAESVWKEAVFTLRNLGALDEPSRTRAQELLTRCGLQEREHDHPYRLSYGEKRRLNLISALAHAPRLILLDETLIGQDAQNATFLMELLRERTEEGSTVVMVNHNPEITRRYASRLLFFNSGHAIVDAPTGEAFQQLDALGRRAYLPRERRWDQSTP